MTTKAQFKPKRNGYLPMGKAEYNAARLWLNVDHHEFCELVGIKARQDRYFRSGDCQVPTTLAKLIRTVIKHKIRPDEIG